MLAIVGVEKTQTFVWTGVECLSFSMNVAAENKESLHQTGPGLGLVWSGLLELKSLDFDDNYFGLIEV